MDSLQPTQPKRRRWLMPVLIIIVALAVAYVGSQRQTQQANEVRQTIVDLCRDTALGKDVSARLHDMTPVEVPRLQDVLRQVCAAPGFANDFDIEVLKGDAEGAGRFAGAATQTVRIHHAGQNVLGLWIKHNGQNKPITILGYWIPQPA